MATNSSVFTRQKMGLDKRVWIVMIVFCILSIGLASYKIAEEKPCVTVMIAINGTAKGTNKTFFIGETVRFSALFAEDKKINWDFGDNSNSELGMRSTHTYKKEGVFPITITINGSCIQHDQVIIKKFMSDTSVANNDAIKSLFGNPIDGNVSPTVMQSVIYSSTAPAKTYEWSISNYSNYAVKNTREAQFVFLTPGLKVLQLMLDGDPSKIYKKDIIVQPLPYVPKNTQDVPLPQVPVYIPQQLPQTNTAKAEPEKPVDKPVDKPAELKPEVKTEPVIEKPKTIRIGNENFKDLLQDVVNNNLDVADFNDYLCDQGKTRVLINDEKNWTNFTALCNKIRGDKRVTVTEVEQTLENNCVVKIKVKYDRKKAFLGIGDKKN
jgi:PKD repeat protein